MIVEYREFFDNAIFKSFLDTFEYSIDSVVITSTFPEEYFLYVNEAFKRKTGYVESDLIGKSPRILQGPKTNRTVIDDLKEKLKNGENFIGQAVNYRKDGTTYIVKWYISALKDINGETIAYISYQKEITQAIWDHKQAMLLASVVNQIDQTVVVTALDGTIVYANDGFIKQSGYSLDDILGKNISFLRSGKQSQSFYKELWSTILQGQSFHGTFINKRKNGEFYYEQKTITPMKNEEGDTEFFVGIGQDITQLIKQNEDYKDKAYHDSLTGLYNRLKFDDIMQRKYREFVQRQKPFSLIMIDIDSFKNVNDTLGHEKGDKVLKELAELLRKTLRSNDLLARWGGEEFVILIDRELSVAEKLAEKVRQAVEKKLKIENHPITISLGISQIKENDTIDTLFARVDKALYISKKEGKNRVTSL